MVGMESPGAEHGWTSRHPVNGRDRKSDFRRKEVPLSLDHGPPLPEDVCSRSLVHSFCSGHPSPGIKGRVGVFHAVLGRVKKGSDQTGRLAGVVGVGAESRERAGCRAPGQ